MTLNRLKFIGIATPAVAAVALELIRPIVIGPISPGKRLLLDLVVVLAIVAFGLVIFRFIDDMQKRLTRQNEELLAFTARASTWPQTWRWTAFSIASWSTPVTSSVRSTAHFRSSTTAGRIEAFITSGVTPEERAAIGPPPVGHGVLGEVLHEGHHLRLADLTKHPRSVGFPANHPPMRSLLAVPINCKGPFKGNLYLSDKRSGDAFSGDDEETLERFAAQAALAIDNAHLHAQVGDLAVAQERLRIAHEMHDGLAQVLGYVNTKVQAANEYLRRGKSEEAKQQLRELADSAREAYTDVRESIIGLRALPNAERSLTDALREFVERWREQSGVAAELSIEPDLRLRPAVELQLIRIVQESLTNIRKHARATKARVDLRREGERLRVTIADDGTGFRPDSAGA